MLNDINQTKNKQINKDALYIANHCALSLAKRCLTIMLIASFVVTILIGADSIPSFYILLTVNLFPYIISYMIRTEDRETLLPDTAKRYHYTWLNYRSNSMSFLLNILFLFLWQQRNLNKEHPCTLIMYLPLMILFIVVIIRLVAIPYYRFKIHHILLYGETTR